MSKAVLKATRAGFGEGLELLGEMKEDIVLLTADLTGSVGASKFAKLYPEKVVSIGIAEQDMAGVSAGLSLMGKIPFLSTFGVFASGRCWEQVRSTICYSNLNVKIASSHCGLTVGEDGASHQALEDIAIMRCIPNISVVVPCDALETTKATLAVAKTFGPFYLRFGRQALPLITNEDTPFEIGKAIELVKGDDLAIIACGIMVHEALDAAKLLKEKGISAGVYNFHTIKPFDAEMLSYIADRYGAIVTAEEHQLAGGLGSVVAENLIKTNPVPVEMVGVNDMFGESGDSSQLLKEYGLLATDLVEASERVLKRKKNVENDSSSLNLKKDNTLSLV